MSKYDPLRRYLETRTTEQAPMTFADVERVLGFALPPSAKAHPTWWSNNTGTHVGVRAWRDAGWKTSRVDVPGGRVVFIRDAAALDTAAEIRTQWGIRDFLPPEQLSGAARKLLTDYTEEAHGDVKAAVARALHEAAIARRGRLMEDMRARAPVVDDDSVDLIREDRDAR
jgi:hypothetical protein